MRHRCRRSAVQRDQGFTLIELLVVIIVIGILAAIAIPVFLNQRKKAVDASLKADLKSLVNAEETWLVDNPSQPGTVVLADLQAGGFQKTSGNRHYVALNASKGGYCLFAWSPADSVGNAAWVVAYDSAAGGFINGGKHVDDATATASPGACGTGKGGWITL